MPLRMDMFKPKPLYGAWLMELAPSRNDPINELGWLWSENKPATGYALARAVKSAEARRAGARDKFDKAKYHSVAMKLRNMLGYRGRLGSVEKVSLNPKRRGKKRKTPGKRRATAQSRKRNPSAAWGRARIKARHKWLKSRFNRNPPRNKRGRFVRRGRR